MKLYFSSTVPAKDKGAKKTNLDSVRGKKKESAVGLATRSGPQNRRKHKHQNKWMQRGIVKQRSLPRGDNFFLCLGEGCMESRVSRIFDEGHGRDYPSKLLERYAYDSEKQL